MTGPVTRRGFLAYLGKGAMALALVGVACAREELTVGEAGAWRRVDLGFVSAYVVVHNEEIAVIDTGVAGSADDIEQVIAGLALGWESVGHVVLTHAHPDHVGSLPEVLARAPDATGYIGPGDLAAVASSRPLQAVGDGDRVMGSLEVIETPGHTPGHISVLDQSLGLLIAGDALRGVDGAVAGPDPAFSDDMDEAALSVEKLASLGFDTVVFGHGEPVEEGAVEQVGALVG